MTKSAKTAEKLEKYFDGNTDDIPEVGISNTWTEVAQYLN